MLSPIIGLLTMNKDIDETVFQEKISDITRSDEEKKSLYDEEAILKSVEKKLRKVIKR